MLEQKLPPPDTDAAYDQVVHGAQTETTRRRGVVTGLAAAAAVAAVLVWTSPGIPDARPDVGPVGDASASTPALVRVDEALDLYGTWRAEPVTLEEMAANVASRGQDSEGLPRVLGTLFNEPGATLEAEFSDGFMKLWADGALIDEQTYTVEEDGVWMRPMLAPGGHSLFTAVIRHGALSLRLLDTTVPQRDGVSGEAALIALYTTVPFERVLE